MKALKRGLTATLAGILLAVSLTPLAYAEENTLSDSAQNVIDERCELIQTKVETKLQNYVDKKAQFETNYEEAKQTLDEIIAYLEGEGYDTASLKTAKTELTAKIDKFKSDYAVLIDKLEDVKADFAKCGDGSGTFAGIYEDAKEQLVVIRDDVKDIRQYFRSNIKSELKEIRRSKVMDKE